MNDARVKRMAKARVKDAGGIWCPECEHPCTLVIDTRLGGLGDRIRRRRACAACGHRFSTYEMVSHPGLSAEAANVRTAHLDALIGHLKDAIAKYEQTRMNPDWERL